MTTLGASTYGDMAAVISAAVAGDDAAFEEIVAANHEDMRRVCVVVAGDEHIADEAVGAAWAIAWQKLGSVRDPARLRPWLVSVAVNEARRLHRARSRRSVVELRVVEQRAMGSPDPDPASAISSIDLRNALARLSVEDRALLAMRYVAGFDSFELGLATGRSASGTRARLARLLDRLHTELGDE